MKGTVCLICDLPKDPKNYCEGKLKLRSQNTSCSLIKVVTRACLIGLSLPNAPGNPLVNAGNCAAIIAANVALPPANSSRVTPFQLAFRPNLTISLSSTAVVHSSM